MIGVIRGVPIPLNLWTHLENKLGFNDRAGTGGAFLRRARFAVMIAKLTASTVAFTHEKEPDHAPAQLLEPLQIASSTRFLAG